MVALKILAIVIVNIFTTLFVNIAVINLIIFFLFFLENRVWNFMQIASLETICLKYETLFSGISNKNVPNEYLVKFLPSMLSQRTCE